MSSGNTFSGGVAPSVGVYKTGTEVANVNPSGYLTVSDEYLRRQMAQNAALQNAVMQSSVLGSRPYLDLKSMILMRMHFHQGAEYPFEFMEAHRSGEMVHVFVVVNGEPLTLSDEHTLFPSDSLITKLNLLRK